MNRIEVNVITGEQTVIPLTPEEIAALPPDPGPFVPEYITQRQCRLFLSRNNMLADVEAAIAEEGGEIAIEWEYAEKIYRNHPAIPRMAVLFDLNSGQIDQFFIAAAQL